MRSERSNRGSNSSPKCGLGPPAACDGFAGRLVGGAVPRRVNRGFKAKSLNLGAPAGKFLIMAHCLVTGSHP